MTGTREPRVLFADPQLATRKPEEQEPLAATKPPKGPKRKSTLNSVTIASIVMSSNFRRIALLRAVKLSDLAVVTVTFVAAFAISNWTFTWPRFTEVLLLRIKVVNFLIFGGYLVFCALVFSACGFYRSHRMSHWTRWNREILLAATLITGVLLVLPLRMEFATKYFYLVFWFLTAGFLTGSRILGQHLSYYVRSHGRNLRNIIIVGEGKDVTALAERIEQEATLGYRVVRVINAEES